MPTRSHGEAQRYEGRDRESEHDEFVVGSHGSGVGRCCVVDRPTTPALEFRAHCLALFGGHVPPTSGIGVTHLMMTPMAEAEEEAYQEARQEYEDQCRNKEREEVEHRSGDDPPEREFPERLAKMHVVFHTRDDATTSGILRSS